MNPDFRADLHCHSTCSDGSDTPQELIDKAIACGLQGLSITDHDTLAAYKQALPYARAKQFPLLTGIEFSAAYKEHPVHILGYAFPPEAPAILALTLRHRDRRHHRNLKILENLKMLGKPVSESDLEGEHAVLGRPHIALAMIKKGYVESVQEAFHTYLEEGKLAYFPGMRITVEETLEAIHADKGLAVIAHPHLGRSSILKRLLKMPFDGIEGYYARMPSSKEAPFIRMGIERNWVVTGGSDYHGTIKPETPLGASWVNQTTFNRLYEHFLSVS